MKKAFIFTFDAVFAVALLTLFLVVVSSEMAEPREPDWLPKLGNQMMKVELMKHGHARVAQGQVVGVGMEGVVADLIEQQIEAAGVKAFGSPVEGLHFEPRREAAQQLGGIVGDAAAGGGQGREECESHYSSG